MHDKHFSEIICMKQQEMTYQSRPVKMILFHRITQFIKYDKLKMENNFNEMVTATVSHDMRTPINAILGTIHNLNQFVHED